VRLKLVCLLPFLGALVAAAPPAAGAGSESSRVKGFETLPYQPRPGAKQVRVLKIHYRAHDGTKRGAYVVLPAWYGPKEHQRIPLVISPHGRGVSGRTNARLWGRLPGRGGFAVVSPDGQGRKLQRFSWGYGGQIDDLARMPQIVERTLPWLRIDRSRIYAVGGSMGGQETLLLLGRHPHLLAGAAAFDSVTDLALQFGRFSRLQCGKKCRRLWGGPIAPELRARVRKEVGGPPWKKPRSYATRSPLAYAGVIARSCVPLQLWWSVKDRVVRGPERQSARLFRRIRRLNPDAPVQALWGYWAHSAAMRAGTRLPDALGLFGLLPEPSPRQLPGVHVVDVPETSLWCKRGG
jgi:pimeloyl-ACP methyl ester carboxylesterase